MTISLTCACGVRLEIDESFAGQTINCPDCQRAIVAPKPEPEGLRTSGFALGSLTLGLVGAFTVIGTLLAVVLGLLGLQSIRRAPERVTGRGFALAGIGLGVGLLVFGAARGIGNIGANAVQSTARQPEAGNAVFLQMIISAALIEGFTFFALIVAGNLAGTWGKLAEEAAKRVAGH